VSVIHVLKIHKTHDMKVIADCGFTFCPDEAFEESYQESDEEQKEITG